VKGPDRPKLAQKNSLRPPLRSPPALGRHSLQAIYLESSYVVLLEDEWKTTCQTRAAEKNEAGGRTVRSFWGVFCAAKNFFADLTWISTMHPRTPWKGPTHQLATRAARGETRDQVFSRACRTLRWRGKALARLGRPRRGGGSGQSPTEPWHLGLCHHARKVCVRRTDRFTVFLLAGAGDGQRLTCRDLGSRFPRRFASKEGTDLPESMPQVRSHWTAASFSPAQLADVFQNNRGTSTARAIFVRPRWGRTRPRQLF